MSTPTGEAPPPPASGTAPAASPAVAQMPPAQHPVVSQGVSGDVAQARPSHTVPVPQGQAPPTGVPAGAAVQVPRQAAGPTRDTFNTRSLGVALNSQVKKVCAEILLHLASLNIVKAHLL